jgi:hypothetical protein
MTAYNTSLYASKQPAANPGFYQVRTHLHATSPSATFALNDTVNVGYLPANAVVTGVSVKAASQLDSNGTPLLTVDLGIVGTTQLFMAASALVGRAAGASFDTTMAAAGKLYKNTTGSQVAVVATIRAAAATPIAGTLEFEVSYFVEDTVGSPA